LDGGECGSQATLRVHIGRLRFNSTASLISLSSTDTVERIRVSWNIMTWSNVCSAIADLTDVQAVCAGGVRLFWFYRATSLSDVNLTTLAGYAVNPRRPQFQVIFRRTKEIGDLPRRQANTFNVVFGLHSAESAVCSLVV
jgi:hypothetical protein